MHAYERDWDSIEALTVNEDTSRTPFADGLGASVLGLTWSNVALRADDILRGRIVSGETEQYSMNKLARFY